jgi:signal transduction histidine kinase
MRLFRALAFTIAGSVIATLVFTETPWWKIAGTTLTTMLFAGPCVVLCVYALPLVVPRAHKRLRFPFDWVAIVAVLAVFGAAGSLVGAVPVAALGLAGRGQSWLDWYPSALKISLYFTVIFGLSGTMIQGLRSRLASTTLALRTKERDEAEARRLVAEAQLASLESRVDPHFLFNTLNSIAALVRDRPSDAERVIEQLSALMRSSLDRRAALVPVDEELQLVRSYLDIERVRFGDRLRFHIEPLGNGAAPLVPRLSLQTLVENSVKYAVSASRDGATIGVIAAEAGGRLRVSVEDDGPGFDATDLPDGHGLQLLKSRLAMTFGDRADLRAESRPGRTLVTLDLPFETSPPQPAADDRQPTAVRGDFCG